MKNLIKCSISMLMVFVVVFSFNIQVNAISKQGVSANTKKANYTHKDTNVVLAVKNDNNYKIGVDIQPQVYKNKKWIDLDWYDFSFLKKDNKVYENYKVKDFKKGKYRFTISIVKFDKKGYEKSREKFNTTAFKIN